LLHFFDELFEALSCILLLLISSICTSSMNKPIYLDYAATTPVDPIVASKLAEFLTMDGIFANPASRSHFYGWQAEAAVENARKQVALLFNADTREVVWTSGATEAINLAVKGVAQSRRQQGKHIITSLAEHKAVIDSVKYLEQHGYSVTWLKPRVSGEISVEDVKQAVRPDTILISLMHVNNETGAITDVYEIAEFACSKGIIFHVDAAQSAGKLVLDTQVLKADLISVSAHKVYGPKGVGALYVRRSPDFELPPQIHGGGHERGMRSGTLPTHQIAAMGEAFRLAGENRIQEQARISQLKSSFLEKISGLMCVRVNGQFEKGVSGIVNISFKGLDGQVLLSALPLLAISSGSACNSATMASSHVLKSMGLSDDMALSALRFSFGRFTTSEDVERAAEMIITVVEKMTL
jgi:cysteine desulfurase